MGHHMTVWSCMHPAPDRASFSPAVTGVDKGLLMQACTVWRRIQPIGPGPLPLTKPHARQA